MSFNCKGELGWSINKISHGDNKQENKSNKNNWGKNNLFRHTSPTVPHWELDRRKISMSLKAPSRWKTYYQYQVSNSNLIKKFTFIDALVINISMRSFDQVKGQIKTKNEIIKIMCSCSKPGLLPTARLLLGVQLHLAPGGVGKLDYYSHEYFHFCTNGGLVD